MSLAFDGDFGDDPVEPPREPPVLVPEELHRSRNQYRPDDGGVHQDRRCEAEAEQLQDRARVERNDAKTVTMIAAAAVITLAVVAMPSATAVALSPVRTYSSRMREIRNTS